MAFSVGAPAGYGGATVEDEARALRMLDELRAKAEGCTKCPLSATRRRVVFGEGRVGLRVMMVGEAPGREEDAQGRPFVGRAGKLLDELLSRVGVDRRMVYITNVVKCRPPGNRPPRRSEVEACREYLLGQLEAVKPRLVVLLGRVAIRAMLGEGCSVTSVRGKPLVREGRTFLPTLHPASALYNPGNLMLLEEDMATFRRLLEG
ncbi:MAG: uracil-DNA glycosylase [Candidatus Freyarchaeota archaeon]|nr:uracil-DNA glycosylase [Candidatus Jordarchaeia archaeon]